MKIEKWYLQTWFISLVFIFSFLIIPFITGVVLLIQHYMEHKKITNKMNEEGLGEIQRFKQIKEELEQEVELYIEKKENLIQETNELSITLNEKQEELVVLEDELLLQSFGFYNPKYDLETSEHYKERLDDIREKQKDLVRDKRATHHFNGWELNGSKQKGKVLNNNNIKLTINAFNTECDMAIGKVKFTNVHSMETRIKKAFANLNRINKHNQIEITHEYLSLKLDELYLAYEYAQQVEEEKEEQRRIREEMREEERARREIEAAKAKIEKEEKHFTQEIKNLQKRLTEEANRENKALLKKIEQLQAKLALIQKDKENVFNREQNTRAGYVYIISNIGSFGEDVYKIGMTRRLHPDDRVRELGDASVPFRFDTHAMIFSHDAPALERALHKAFDHKRVNKVNNRKEFFHVTLREIQEEIVKNHSEVVQFTKMAEAKEYRESLTQEAMSA
ncbi:DUF4041 domain-containing protein [Priestia sp. OVL9]|nr:DUF4041 domain-containing protein [Priestia sp. OVL9]